MKITIRILLLTLVTFLGLSWGVTKVNAYEVVEHDLTDDWWYVATDVPALTYLNLTGYFGQGTQIFEFITGPLVLAELELYDLGMAETFYSYITINYADETYDTILLEDLFGDGEALIDFNNSPFTISLNRTNRELSASGVGGVHVIEDNYYGADFRNAVSFELHLLLDTTTFDYDDMLDFKVNQTSILTSGMLTFQYWVGGELYLSKAGYTIPNREPTSPDIPVGYELKGWKTKTGDYIVFDGDPFVPDEWIITGTTNVPLYAHIVLVGGAGYTPEEPVLNMPEGLAGLVSAFGFGDGEGYTLLFVALVVITCIGLAVLKVPSPAIIITVTIEFVAFIFIGALPVSAIILFGVLLLALYVITFRRSEAVT